MLSLFYAVPTPHLQVHNAVRSQWLTVIHVAHTQGADFPDFPPLPAESSMHGILPLCLTVTLYKGWGHRRSCGRRGLPLPLHWSVIPVPPGSKQLLIWERREERTPQEVQRGGGCHLGPSESTTRNRRCWGIGYLLACMSRKEAHTMKHSALEANRPLKILALPLWQLRLQTSTSSS